MSNPLHARCRDCDGLMSVERAGEDKPGICWMCEQGIERTQLSAGTVYEFDVRVDDEGKAHPIPGTTGRVFDPGLVPKSLRYGICVRCGGYAPRDGRHDCGCGTPMLVEATDQVLAAMGGVA